MSSVMFALTATDVMLATDTLGTPYSGEGRRFFATKAHALPHMNVIMATLGICGFLEIWWNHLNTGVSYPGIEACSWSAQAELKTLWTAFVEKHQPPKDAAQAIFMFGASEFTGEMLGFGFMSWDDFRPVELSYRAGGGNLIWAKPSCSVPEGATMKNFPAAFVPMMLEQRSIQEEVDNPEQKVHIGGEIVIHHLGQRGLSIYKLARFPEYGEVESGLWGDFRKQYAATLETRTAAFEAGRAANSEALRWFGVHPDGNPAGADHPNNQHMQTTETA